MSTTPRVPDRSGSPSSARSPASPPAPLTLALPARTALSAAPGVSLPGRQALACPLPGPWAPAPRVSAPVPGRGRSLTDGGDEGGVEGVLREAEQEAGFADAGVADEQQFEQIIVRLRHLLAPALSDRGEQGGGGKRRGGGLGRGGVSAEPPAARPASSPAPWKGPERPALPRPIRRRFVIIFRAARLYGICSTLGAPRACLARAVQVTPMDNKIFMMRNGALGVSSHTGKRRFVSNSYSLALGT